MQREYEIGYLDELEEPICSECKTRWKNIKKELIREVISNESP